MNRSALDFKTMMVILAVTHFVIHTYTQLIPALLPTLKKELGVSLVQASLLISIPMMANVIANIPAGIISDRVGSRILALCFLINMFGASLILVSKDFMLLVLGAGLISFASTFYHPPSLKASSLLNPAKMNLAMAAHLAGGTLGIATGPILLGALMPFFGWRAAYLAWMPFNLALSFVTHHFIGKIREEPLKDNGSKGSALGGLKSLMTLNLGVAILAGAFMEVAVMNLSSFIPTYFQVELGMSQSLASVVYGLGPLTGIVGAFAGGSSGDRFGLYKSSTIILVVVLGLVALIPITKIFLVVSVLYVVYRGSIASFMPLMQSIIAKNSPEENRSLAFSVFSMVANVGASVTPIITSILAENYSIAVIFPISLLLLIPSVSLISFLRMRVT